MMQEFSALKWGVKQEKYNRRRGLVINLQSLDFSPISENHAGYDLVDYLYVLCDNHVDRFSQTESACFDVPFSEHDGITYIDDKNKDIHIRFLDDGMFDYNYGKLVINDYNISRAKQTLGYMRTPYNIGMYIVQLMESYMYNNKNITFQKIMNRLNRYARNANR